MDEEDENYMTCTDYIPLEECKDGYLYRLYSRNLAFGIFIKDKNGFEGIREKFGKKFLFIENHWDVGEPFGTVKPIEELHFVDEKNSIELFKILHEFELKHNWTAFGPRN